MSLWCCASAMCYILGLEFVFSLVDRSAGSQACPRALLEGNVLLGNGIFLFVLVLALRINRDLTLECILLLR